ncbi:hypothetical protein P4493_10080 [Bacillus thuringiensis]|uniref:hypothetical protein n=1 Tax=Bacillus TaxID=1386 RepID=UPI0002FA1F58|nr:MULTISPECIES: hypothetical protein [Bacillus]MEC3434213.1 hypothetical protein [Bacillus cereus]AJH02425.1 hypothetical protein AS86_6632 [Bacillus thuringiensis HD1002]MCC4009886.1 hypothetical protein [Bacillus thuringiensis]MCC4029011.1 hypothetical protein [Bacillus thuringiensis]MCR6820020.1 hypothetical protein [Bacillus thuringiensis]
MLKKIIVCLSTAVALATIITISNDSKETVVKADTTYTQQAEAITSGISWWWE